MEKVELPRKTKNAAWLMIFQGIFLYLLPFYISNRGERVLFSLFFLIPLAIFLLQKKKWAWWFSIIFIPMYIVVMLFSTTLHYMFGGIPDAESLILLIPLIAFILLLLDRKNFWKIAT